MRYGEEKELVYWLRDLIGLEQTLEESRIRVVQHHDFNLVDCFRIFDATGRGWATFEDFREGLASLRVYTAHSDLDLVFQRYDRDKDGTLRYSEFCDLFMPKSAEFASILNQRGSQYIHRSYLRREEYFHPETRISLEELFRTHLDVEIQAERIRQQMRSFPKFDLFEAFQTCDLNHSGAITSYEM